MKSSRWLLKLFWDCMHGREPITIIMDDDKATHTTARDVYPNAYHMICA